MKESEEIESRPRFKPVFIGYQEVPGEEPMELYNLPDGRTLSRLTLIKYHGYTDEELIPIKESYIRSIRKEVIKELFK